MQNFNMSFSNNKADVLIHLTQWQYWWWFWFAFLWVLYYLLVARVFRYRTLKFNPRIASTLRPHGKWGDLLTCIIPITWCINILINSNFILKLIEWQSESSLFTLRVRAKQWYWIYKLDLRNVSDIFSAPRNIGRNKWQSSTFGDLQTAEDYLHIMQMRAYVNWSKDFWIELNKKLLKKNKFNVSSPVDVYKTEFVRNAELTFYKNTLDFKNLSTVSNTSYNDSDSSVLKDSKFNNNLLFSQSGNIAATLLKGDKANFLSKTQFFGKSFIFEDTMSENILEEHSIKKLQPAFVWRRSPTKKLLATTKIWSITSYESFNNFFKGGILNKDTKKVLVQHSDLEDDTRIMRRSFGKATPLRILKHPNDSFFFKDAQGEKDTNVELFRLRFNDKKASYHNKPIKPTVYLTFKQKRYNQRANIGKKTNIFVDRQTKQQHTYSGNPFLKNAAIIEENFGNPTRQYRLVKKAKARLDTTKVASWNRLLRSRRVLVLPAHINITVITNSFDVVHSWHIPGLGLKMDCLPGRATHHTLYIDNVGLYYGQCAEVCGRYHHHMPIRVCALPFEHFLVWWHTFGLPKFLFPVGKERQNLNTSKYFSRKFSW